MTLSTTRSKEGPLPAFRTSSGSFREAEFNTATIIRFGPAEGGVFSAAEQSDRAGREIAARHQFVAPLIEQHHGRDHDVDLEIRGWPSVADARRWRREHRLACTRYDFDDAAPIRGEPTFDAFFLPGMKLQPARELPLLRQPSGWRGGALRKLERGLALRMLALPKLHLEELLQKELFRGWKTFRVIHVQEEPSPPRTVWSKKSLDHARTDDRPSQRLDHGKTLRRAELLSGVRRGRTSAGWKPARVFKGPCWCAQLTVSAAALERLLGHEAERRCLCRSCRNASRPIRRSRLEELRRAGT